MWRLAARSSSRCLPLAAAAFLSSSSSRSSSNNNNDHPKHGIGIATRCDAAVPLSSSSPSPSSSSLEKIDPAVDSSLPPLVGGKSTATTHQTTRTTKTTTAAKSDNASFKKAGMNKNAVGIYHDLFPLRQKFEPKLEYPLWDYDWDGRTPPPSGYDDADRRKMRLIRKNGITRHIILVRHGQYDESQKSDEMRRLTPLGRYQAEQTGKRLANMLKGTINPTTGQLKSCRIKSLQVSAMRRAIETADIIATYLPPEVTYAKPDPLLNEGRPCHHIPGNPASERMIKATDEGHARIEKAFEKYFYRAHMLNDRIHDNVGMSHKDDVDDDDDNNNIEEDEKHEFEIIVCHANVIRYFLCRALQLPPEAWLRYCPFNCSLTYIAIRPTGSVSCRMVGDIGHLAYDSCTFSTQHGYVW